MPASASCAIPVHSRSPSSSSSRHPSRGRLASRAVMGEMRIDGRLMVSALSCTFGRVAGRFTGSLKYVSARRPRQAKFAFGPVGLMLVLAFLRKPGGYQVIDEPGLTQ